MSEFVIIQDNRLVYHRKKKVDKDMWDKQWFDSVSDNYYRRSLQGNLDFLEKPILKYFDKDDLILEAGCGLSKYVVSLNKRGYRCEGIDYASNTIKRVKKKFPEIPVEVGDLKNINRQDGYYSKIISLGVIEHEKEGPNEHLKELNRVLKPGGIAFISVPYINLIRKMKIKYSCYAKSLPSGYNFYQYAFGEEEMNQILEKFGFRVIDIYGYGAWKGIKDEISFFQKIYNIPKIGGLYSIITKKISLIERNFGHMIGFVCKKK